MNTLKRLQAYMGGRKFLLPISLTMSALSNIVGLLPFILMWLIVRDLLGQGIDMTTNVNQYAWWAVITAIVSIVLYFAALMFSHLAAFRVEVNLKREAMKKIVNMPLGFFDKKSGGSIRKIIDDDSSTTHTFLAHQLPDVTASLLTPIVIIAMLFYSVGLLFRKYFPNLIRY